MTDNQNLQKEPVKDDNVIVNSSTGTAEKHNATKTEVIIGKIALGAIGAIIACRAIDSPNPKDTVEVLKALGALITPFIK